MFLIVGLGPVGLLLANLLGKAGHRVIGIDKQPSLPKIPRAIAIDGESLRILQWAEIAPALFPHLKPHEGLHFFDSQGKCYLQTAIDEQNGYEPSYLFDQPKLEEILIEGCRRFPKVELRWGHELHSLEKGVPPPRRGEGTPTGCGAMIQDAAESYFIQADFIIGCDGANSKVRQLLKIPMKKLWAGEGLLLKIDAWDHQGQLPPLNAVQKFSSHKGAWVQMEGIRRHRRWEFQLGEKFPQHLEGISLEVLASEKLQAIGVNQDAIEKLTWRHIAPYRYQSAIAAQWRQGRVFLAGDAAHLTPPFIGQGLCMGIKDAGNLFWKLDQAAKGDGSEALLNSYQSERLPHARFSIRIAVAVGWLFKSSLHKWVKAGIRLLRLPFWKEPLKIAPPPLGSKGYWMKSPQKGALFPQFKIQQGESEILSDELLGNGWVLLSLKESFSNQGMPQQADKHLLLDEAAVAHAPLAKWMRERGIRQLLLRPDKRIYWSQK